MLFAAGVASAELCTSDVVPAATLLVPYFEVDFQSPDSANTIVEIRNALAEPALTQVTLWTDWAAGSLHFNLFLPGLASVELDFYEMFAFGNLPITADAQSDPDDTISPAPLPAWDGSFEGCGPFFPFPEPAVVGDNLDRLRGAHAGTPIAPLGGQCLGGAQTDGRARGWVTIDSVDRCDFSFPWETGYFDAGGLGIANDENRLTGTTRLVNPATGLDVTVPVVHLEADPSLDTTTGATFYGRLFSHDGRDHREPLDTSWSAAFEGTGSRTAGATPGTDFLVWRDPTDGEVLVGGAECGVGPEWLGLSERQVVCSGGGEIAVPCSGSECFPTAIQRVSAGPGGLGLPMERGACRFDLNDACPGCSPGGLGSDGLVAQSFVAALTTRPAMPPSGTLVPGTGLASACDEAPEPLEIGAVFVDGFGSGDTTAWDG